MSACGRAARTAARASSNVHPYARMRKATTIPAERDLPSLQCTSTQPSARTLTRCRNSTAREMCGRIESTAISRNGRRRYSILPSFSKKLATPPEISGGVTLITYSTCSLRSASRSRAMFLSPIRMYGCSTRADIDVRFAEGSCTQAPADAPAERLQVLSSEVGREGATRLRGP